MIEKEKYSDVIENLDEHTYHITQEMGTDEPFTHPYDQEFGDGIYVDIITKKPLFSSKDKFDAGCGWPAFTRPLKGTSIVEEEDRRFGLNRIEVATETTHLGHVFEDGPKEAGGLRYCINGSSVAFIPKDELEEKGYGEYLDLFDEK